MRLSVFAASLVLLNCEIAYAQNAEIIVTGQGLGQGLGEHVYDIIVIDRGRLTGSASGRLDEILKEVPGFQMFRRSDSRSANPTSQGATLRALGGNASGRALLILDGVPQSDPFGGWINWPAYDPQRLGAVRVVRGGGSGAYGPGSLAGTIEMISASPSELGGASGAVFYGSRNSVDANAAVGADVGAGFVTASANFGRGGGFIPVINKQRGTVDRPSPYEQASMSLRAVAPVTHDVELQATTLWFTDERERGTAFTENRTTGADAALRLVGLAWQAVGYIQTRDYYNSFASVGAGRNSVNRVAEQYSVPSTGLGARFEVRPVTGAFELRLGGDWRETMGESRERYNFQNDIATRHRIAGGRTRTFGGFMEAGWEQGGLTLTGGARLDRWRILDGKLDERVFATGLVLNDIAFANRGGWEPTGRAGMAWSPAASMTLRSAAYFGWRLPTLNELYRPFRIGADATAANAALTPERLRGIEAGVEFRPFSGGRLSATIFANRLKNAVANITLGEGPGMFPGVGFVAPGGQYRQRQNLEAIDARGVELNGRIERGAWSFAAGYSFVEADVEAQGPAHPLNSLRPAQTPRHSFSSTVAWRSPSGAGADLTARHTGAQFEDDLNQQILPNALTLDATAAIPITRSLTIEARAENVTGARVVSGISGDGIVERATPRSLWLGLRLRH